MLAVALALLMVAGATAPSLATPATAQGADATRLSSPETLDQPTDYRTGSRAGANDTSDDAHVRTTNVTLVTGQTVTVVRQGDRTTYHVEADEPVQKIDTPRGTYVFPAGVDLSTFDPALFNVDLLVEQQFDDAETDSVPVIVQLGDGDEETDSTLSTDDRTRDRGDGERSPGPAREELNETRGLTADQSLESVGAVAGHIEKARGESVAEALQANPDVEKVYLDARVEVTLDDLGNLTSAGQARERFGVDGSNVTVAVLDTGVDDTHPDLAESVVAEKDFTGENTTDDLHGHGTHVAGIVAGDGSASNGTYTGVAPGADVMNVRVLDSDGYGSRSDIIEGIEYAVANGADVISMSLGGPVYSDDPYRAAIRNATDAGVTVVVAAGNDGEAYGTVGSPGVVPEAITVGASNDSDDIASFSSRGPTPLDRYVKPDLVAPGVSITSADAGTDGYVSYSGTSMATPAVSGAAALLLEEHPNWTTTQVRSALVTTTDPLDRSHDVYTQGSGRLNASAALESTLTFEESTVDFGVFTNGTEETRVVSIANRGTESRTLNVSAAAKNIDDGSLGNVTANVSSVTVPANGTGHVALTVNTTNDSGVYSGTLSFDDGNYTAIFGYVRTSRLTVEKTGPGNVSEDLVFVFAEETGKIVTIDYFGDDGAVTSAVTAGNYTVMTAGIDETAGNESVFMRESVTVQGSESVAFDESETVRYQLDTSNVTDDHGPLANLTAVSQMHDVVGGYNYSWTYRKWFAEARTARFSNGSYNASVSYLLAPEEHYDASGDPTHHLDSPVAYALTHPTRGVNGSRTFEVNDTSLARTNYTYYRNEPGESYWVNPYVSHDRWGDYVLYYGSIPYTYHWLGAWSLGDRTEQTIYQTPATGTYNRSHVLDAYEEVYWGWALWQPEWFTPEAGGAYETSINEHPYAGQRTNWTLDPDAATNFSVEARFMADQPPGRHVYDHWSYNEYAVYRNGSLVYHDIPWWDWLDAEYANGSALAPNTTYQIQMWGDNDDGTLSTEVYTSYYGEYQPGTDNVPPEIASIDAPGRTINNTIPEGSATVTVGVADDANLSNVSLRVAYAPGPVDAWPYSDGNLSTLDDGWSWASVSADGPGSFSATLDTSGLSGETVHLAVHAEDGDGNVVDVTTFHAFAVRDLAPPEVNVSASPADHVSARNPANITVASTDAHPGTTVVDLTDGSGGLLARYDVTDAVADGPTTIEWNATNATGAPLDSGTYNVTVRSVDALGNENVTTASLTVDHAPPTVEVTALDGNETARTAPGGRTVYTNGTVSVNVSADGTPGEAAGVTLRFDAKFTNFGTDPVPASRTEGTSWTRTADLSNLTDDGAYSVNVTAVDPGLNGNATTANATVVLDRDDPELGATVTRLDRGNASVNVTADERLVDGSLNVTVEDPSGNESVVSMTRQSPTRWNGTFALDGSGDYRVTAAGVDLAGNRGTDDASTAIENVSTEDRQVTVLVESSGLFVNFTTEENVQDTFVTITQSDTPLAPLTKGNAGVSFLNAKLGEHLDRNLSYAIVGIPVEEDLPGNVEDPEDVTIRYYNETTDSWEREDTEVREVTLADGTTGEYWVANVSHFSTYGAVASDDTAPSLDSASPSGDLPSDTSAAEVRFEYSDDLSGVDASAIRLNFTGTEVTNDPSTTITSQYATYDATGLSDGTYTATVTVVDEAGNDATYETTFTVGDTGSASSSGGGGGGGSVPPPSILKTVEPLADGGVAVTIQNGLTGRTASLYETIEAGDATFDRLRVTYAYDLQEFTFQIHPTATRPADAPAIEGVETLGFLTVEKEVQNGYFETVEFRFDVPKSALPEGASADDVALYRYDGSSWSELETSRRGTTYTATAPGFSIFAVGVDSGEADEEPTTEPPTTTPVETTTSVPDEPTDTTTTPEDGQPGFGIVVALLALLAVALLRRR